nr:hypothetical protein [Tanacetum cinerariifolium]
MTRSSTSKLFTPYKEPEREFGSSRRHFKTLSLDELRSPDFNLFSDQEYLKDEVAETMEQYMSKTRADYGSGVARLKIKDNDNFELKGQFLKELQMQEVILFYKGLGIPTRRILDSRGAIPSKTAADAKERGFGSLPSSTKSNSRDQVKSISTTIEVDSCPIRRIGSVQYAVSTRQNRTLILFLSTARAKIDVYKRKTPLRVGEEMIIFTSVKPASSLIKRVYMLSLRERIELDLEARLMGETLVLNRSLDSFFEDYIELNDLCEPFELKRNQGDDLMPTIKEGEVIEEFRTKDDELDAGIDDYPSYYDYDKKIHIDYDKMVYKGNNVVGAIMNVPIFVGAFYVVTNFVVLKNMDDYRDEGMGDVNFGKPFLRNIRIKTRRFEGMITIYNDNDDVTYQMVRSHPRFKNHTNEQCKQDPTITE